MSLAALADPVTDRMVVLTCATCGCAFTRLRSEWQKNERRGARSFCSLRCSAITTTRRPGISLYDDDGNEMLPMTPEQRAMAKHHKAAVLECQRLAAVDEHADLDVNSGLPLRDWTHDELRAFERASDRADVWRDAFVLLREIQTRSA
jgi:endogenous inhibitor of DNA gyrase (YacG/DUF329 family)